MPTEYYLMGDMGQYPVLHPQDDVSLIKAALFDNHSDSE
ncbi:hypothetical protein JCM19239_82 [Vibrio variabilis]|uniref:Uncharacterized protein n=1 Tax=Vibrio variabilis TaxID=990271 RepID=A0ABQ0JDQ6_9VIBR|nr:hypothetical protein JCM19239_82 [Vibrio variabilis]